MIEEIPRRIACPTCSRRLMPHGAVKPDRLWEYRCPRCGGTGHRRVDGALVWSASGDGSVESRRARASWKHDGLEEMKGSGAAPLPGMGEG